MLARARFQVLAADQADLRGILGDVRPDFGPFGEIGDTARLAINVIMAGALLLCFALAIWGAAKQRIGSTALRDTFSAEQGKGLIIAGLVGVVIIGSLQTVFVIMFGLGLD